MEWPDWWSWEMELSPHLLKRMVDRQFNEVDLRTMMEVADGYSESQEEGRFVIATTHDEQAWEVIVQPSSDDSTLIIVTAYPLD